MANGNDYMGLVPVTMSDEHAIAAFVARYHKQPAEVKRNPTCILVGPKPKPAYTDPAWLEDFVSQSGRGGRRVA